MTYANRYTYESGNPLLRPTIIQRLDLNASYKWIYAGLSYQHGHDGWVYRGEQYDANDPTITLLNYVNIDDWDKLYASVSLSPTIGLWSPQWQVMLSQQWFPADTPDGHTTFNNPSATFVWQNHFKLPKGWGMNIDGEITTRGDSETFRLAKPLGSLDFGLSKSFLKNSLTLQLWATDLLNTSRAELTMYSGNRLMYLDQDSRRRFRLTIRYRFNATKSKYKGTGAGREQRSRM